MGGSVATDVDDVNIPDSCWDNLGKKATPYFTSIVPALHTLYVYIILKKYFKTKHLNSKFNCP